MPKSIRERLAASQNGAAPRKRRTNAEIRRDAFKEAVEENSRPIARASRRAGKVRQYEYAVPDRSPDKKLKPRTHKSFFTPANTPKPLSPEAEWMEDKPDDVSPIDWMRVMPGWSASIAAENAASGGFTVNRDMILAALKNRGALTVAELREDTGLTKTGVITNLRVMQQLGVVETAGGVWRVVAKGD